jgi:hypothetical protein
MSTCLSSKNGTKARKPHHCCLCGERISIGDTQDIRTGVGPDGMWTMHMHPECHAYEQKPGIVDPDWYENVSDPAFKRADALADSSPNV